MFERGKVPKCSIFEISSGELTNPLFYEEIENLIDKIEPHKSDFKKLKSDYPEIHMVLEVVIELGNETPALNFSNRTVELMAYLEADIDCDIYNRLS